MKAYFYIKDIFQETVINNSDEYVCKIHSVKVGGVEKLTANYFSETTSNFEVPINTWEFSDCTDNGTLIDACGLSGVSDSWNPFFSNLNASFDNVVNTKNRGGFLQSNSTNLYGIEGMGFGFDQIAVPINDLPSGGSSGSSGSGAFFVDFDKTQNFEFIIRVQKQTSLGASTNDIRHLYTYNATTGAFSYTYQNVLPAVPGPPIDATPFAFLSGGNAGWINTEIGSTGTLGNNPIVTQSICLVPTTPQQPTSIVTEALDECCYKSPVLASLSDPSEWQNDINSFLFKRNFSSETITLTLQKNGVTDLPIINNDYGIYYDFGTLANYPDYKGIQIQWQKVLLLEGEGSYRLKVESSFISGAITEFSISFDLKQYSQERANGTFRIQSVMNRYLEHIDFDFTGLNWVDGLRVQGFFGNRQAEYEDEYIIYANRNSKRNRTELINNYSCQTMLIPDCITDEIIEYHNFANKLIFTDYNLNNHKKNYVQKEVVFDTMETIEYNSTTNFVSLELKYKDFVQNYLGKFCK